MELVIRVKIKKVNIQCWIVGTKMVETPSGAGAARVREYSMATAKPEG
jgi:hypothetical protein